MRGRLSYNNVDKTAINVEISAFIAVLSFFGQFARCPPSGDRRGKRGKTMPQAAEDKVFFSKEPQSRLCENSGQDFFL